MTTTNLLPEQTKVIRRSDQLLGNTRDEQDQLTRGKFDISKNEPMDATTHQEENRLTLTAGANSKPQPIFHEYYAIKTLCRKTVRSNGERYPLVGGMR
jgi:hypothetical protein